MFVLAFTPARELAEDPVPLLIRTLSEAALRREPERTAGHDAIALSDRAEPAIDALRAACEIGTWCVGLGIGGVDHLEPAETRALRGPAVDAANAALRAARTTSQVPLAIRAADPRQQDTAADAEAVLRLIGWMIRTRNAGQWRTVHALRRRPDATQRDLAAELGVTQQTVSRAVKTSGWREESSAYPLLVRLLSMIDLTSRR